MITVSIGIGKNDDAKKAGEDAALTALASLPNKRADCTLVFGSSMLDQDALVKGIKEIIKDTPMIGCSSAWEISSEAQVAEGSVVVIAISSDQIRFSTGFGTHLEWNPRQSGKDCAQTIDPTARLVLLFANMLSGGIENALIGARDKINKQLAIVAGGAADNLRFYETSQYFKSSAYSDAMVALGLSGMFTFESVSVHGFLPVGILRKITKIKDNRIIEIDHKPAINLYEEYFGEEYSTMIKQGRLMSYASSYPLGIYESGSVRPTLRIPTHIDTDSGEIFCGGTLPANNSIRLMISDKQQNLSTAKDAATMLLKKLGGKKPKIILMISSVARRKILGVSASLEIREVQDIIGPDVPIAGYYGYSEYADSGENEKNVLLNNGSLVLLAIAE